MRFTFLVAVSLLLSAEVGALAQSAPTCADLHLVPAVRECDRVNVLSASAGVQIKAFLGRDRDLSGPLPPGNFLEVQKEPVISEAEADANAFAAEDLMHKLSESGVKEDNGHNGIRIFFNYTKDQFAQNVLINKKLTFDLQLHDEGYIITSRGKFIFVIAETSSGFFYAAQTIKQLIRGTGKDAVILIPTIRDWPAMAHRGLSDDWSRGPLPNMEFLKREIRTLAAYKYNTFSPYFEHTFAYSSTPVAAFPGGAVTPEEARELVAYAAQYHITIIPEQESFGHLHHVLKFEQYAPLGETAHGAVLVPGDPATLPLIGGWFGELAKVFPGPYAHIGADETFELGLGRTREAVKQQGLGKVYLDFLGKIHEQLAPNHKQLLFWGDIAVNSPELVGTLPKDMIAVPWRYNAAKDFTPLILPFTKAGLETWVAPGVNNWNRLYPNNHEALGNIRAFVRDGQKLGAKGMLNTIWNDDGEGLFDENWFGVLFGAAAGWQAGESSEDSFVASYGQAFHRDETGKISLAQRELMAAHAVLRDAGLGDAQDSYFWLDPFSAEGQRIGAKLNPVAAELRLHAERAITLLAEARATGKLENPEALDALELGARRIDFVGYKFQTAAECAALYTQAQALAADQSRWSEVEVMLETIGSNNGRLQDMRDGYALLGELYRQAWLRDNRSYWLQNNMARYEQAAQLWIGRADRWNLVQQQWWNTHTLPAAGEAGLPVGVVQGMGNRE
ncbi:MAG: family 20 glycosylhydrolase [Terracidiphilus sp.]